MIQLVGTDIKTVITIFHNNGIYREKRLKLVRWKIQ